MGVESGAAVKRWVLILLVAGIFVAAVLFTDSRWDGDVTEGAATPLAEKAGVEESEVLPWKIDGDLLLFFFLSGGAVAGFAAGYYWRTLFPGSKSRETM
ncbi:MAG: hypothetical protein Q7K29_01880 [Thermoleophilia bacterium]|nr:hypothetical protein [Thermoleophilia bacterium]